MNKPIISHCRNCEYCNIPYCRDTNLWCKVKYKGIDPNDQRITALFYRYYKKYKEGDANE